MKSKQLENKTEGYWKVKCKSAEKSDLPWPKITKKPVDEKFLKALAVVEKKATTRSYRGSSKCRICKCHNGSTDHVYNGWVWPSGYNHYMKEHNVHPSKEFIRFIFKETNLFPDGKKKKMKLFKRAKQSINDLLYDIQETFEAGGDENGNGNLQPGTPDFEEAKEKVSKIFNKLAKELGFK